MATKQKIFSMAIVVAGALAASAQSTYSINTPKPISPAEGTTTPSAQATQRQNPYLGSVPDKSTGTTIRLSLPDALARGLRYNLGLVESEHASSATFVQGYCELCRRCYRSSRPLPRKLSKASATGKSGYSGG